MSAIRTACRLALDGWQAAHPQPVATLAQLADHIDHIARRIGADHVGVGADFDGGGAVAGFADVGDYPALFTELARRGYRQADLEKIASRNMLRVMRGAEAYAAAHRGDPPVEFADRLLKSSLPARPPIRASLYFSSSTGTNWPSPQPAPRCRPPPMRCST